MKYFFYFKFVLVILTITCNVVSCKEKNKAVTVTGVTLDKTVYTLEMGKTETVQLNVAVIPENATNKKVAWKSSNEIPATVSNTGMVTAKTAGETTISVITDDGAKTATCEVKVLPEAQQSVHVESVSLDKTSVKAKMGNQLTISAGISPENADNKTVNWSSSDPTVASVISTGLKAEITATKVGNATITVTTEDGGHSAECAVTVYMPSAAYSTTVSSENQQIVKGLGGGLPWPIAGSGFPITNYQAGMDIVLNMGISIARIYWHNQYQRFDANGDPTSNGQTLINGILAEVRWLNDNNIPYHIDGGINNMPRECYFNDPATGHLLEEYEPAQVKTMLHVLNAIRNADLKLPLVVVPFNEPSAPINGGNNNPNTGSMSREQCVRISKLLRAEMDNAGFNEVLLGYSENGEPMYANFYAGNDIGGKPDAYGGLFVDVAGGEKNWPFFNPASPRYDAELDAAIGAFTTHSYWTGNSSINDYVNGYNLTNKGRDNWMTEYCLWGGNSSQITSNYNQELLRKFISDMVFFKFNYWEFWNIWNRSSSNPCTDILCGGSQNRKPAAYYALAKIFKNITPGETYVRRLTTNLPNFTVTNNTAMDGGAFVGPDKTVTILINRTSNDTSTDLKGLYGQSAQVFQIIGNDNNLFDIDMSLTDTPAITDGKIDYITLPRNTITIIVTDGGYGE